MKRQFVITRSIVVIAAAVLVAAMTACCGGYGESDSLYTKGAAPEPAAEYEAMRSEAVQDSAAPMMPAEDVPAPVDGRGGGGGEAGGGSAAADRKQVYNGSAGIVVDDVEQARLELENLADESGGYVESSYSEYIVIRVPAEKFEEIFDIVLESGRVEYSRVETLDVTEAYADIDRRLGTAQETRERLYYLLERSTDPGERARILREIGRLTEEIESLKQQIALMESRISFSTISIQLIPRIQGELSRGDIPFPWIAWLDPMVPAGSALKVRAEINPGEDWAVFSRESVFLAESATRDSLSVSTIANDPRGDAEFWGQALEHHLAPFYAELTPKEIRIGETAITGVELLSKDRYPFRYFVGVIPDGKNLHVVEIFSPDGGKDFSGIYKALEGGSLR